MGILPPKETFFLKLQSSGNKKVNRRAWRFERQGARPNKVIDTANLVVGLITDRIQVMSAELHKSGGMNEYSLSMEMLKSL